MKLIPLTKGKFTEVDDEDFDWLNQWKWHANKTKHTCYAIRHTPMINNQRTKVLMHREILNVRKEVVVDHKDGNGLNNQRSNIRKCTTSQNLMNQKPRIGLTSQYKGVSFLKSKNRWRVQIGFNGGQIFLGYFKSEVEAAKCYDNKAKELYNEFAKPNFS